MSQSPGPSSRALSITSSPFEVLASRAAGRTGAGQFFPFHLGDSYLLPAAPAREIDLDNAGIHRYCPVSGLPHFRAAVAEWVGPQLGLTIDPAQVIAAPGCTGALSLVVTTLFNPGDEVVVITPSWPLILGILRSQAVVDLQVPIAAEAWPEQESSQFSQRLQAVLTPRTRGIYFCDPNNPVGFVWPHGHIEAVSEIVKEHKLWLITDIVYKDLILDDATWHVPSLAQDPELSSQLVLTGSFSKSHLLAGHRAGFIIAPPEIARLTGKVVTYASYHASTSAQEMAVAALTVGAAETRRVCSSYADGLAAVEPQLSGLFHHPSAGAFVFVDLRGLVADATAAMDLLVRCIDHGIALAPGVVFGDDFSRFARLCYTATPPAQVHQGTRRLAQVLNGQL